MASGRKEITMKWLPVALALLTATPSHADEETKETRIRFSLQVLGTVVMYAGHCDVPLGPGVFGRVLGKLSDVLEASGVTQEEIKRYAQSALHAGWDEMSAEEKAEVCSAKTKSTIELLDNKYASLVPQRSARRVCVNGVLKLEWGW
jgi:hypothetical protein